MLVVPANSGKQSDDLRTVAAKHQDQGAALDGNFGVEFEVVQAGNNRRQIAGTAMFFVVGEHPGRAIAIIRDFKPCVPQFLDETRGAKCGGSLLSTSQKCRSAGTRANQGNLLRLTDDFDRQSGLLKFLKIRLASACRPYHWQDNKVPKSLIKVT